MKKKRFIILTAVCFFVISVFRVSTSEVFASNTHIDNEIYKAFEALARAQVPAYHAEKVLYNFFEQDKNNNYIFPDVYGGCYINENNIFVIKVLDINNIFVTQIASLMPDEASYIFEETTISRNNLYDIFDEVTESLKGDPSIRTISLSEK